MTPVTSLFENVFHPFRAKGDASKSHNTSGSQISTTGKNPPLRGMGQRLKAVERQGRMGLLRVARLSFARTTAHIRGTKKKAVGVVPQTAALYSCTLSHLARYRRTLKAQHLAFHLHLPAQTDAHIQKPWETAISLH